MTFHKHHYNIEKLIPKKLNLTMTITKVLIPLEDIRLFYRIQRNIDGSFKYNTRKDGACGSFFIELMEETKKKQQKSTKIVLPDKMPDSVVGLARFFQIEETYTKDKNTLNLLIP